MLSFKSESMEEVIVSQQKDKKPEEVEVLYLDNVKSSTISGITADYIELKKLSLVNDGLTSIDGLPVLPKLEWLHLSDNKLTNGLDTLPEKCPLIKTLSLAGNRIATLKDLKPLSQLEHLNSLDLFNCPVTKVEDYRSQVFAMLPSINLLDGLNKDGEEVDEESEGEEEEDEGVEEESDDEEPGLNYLTKELGSDSSDDEEDYDPDQDEPGEDDDEFAPSDDGNDDGVGPSSSKKRKLDTDQPPPAPASDSDSD